MARRPLNVFALSFLDCICCGFGAVILVFMIISSRVNERSDVVLGDLQTLSLHLQARSLAGHANLDELQSALAERLEERTETQAQVIDLRGLLQRLREQLAALRGDDEERARELARIKAQLKDIEVQEKSEDTKDRMREIAGQGSRQYLTGLKMGGRRILIMIDASASMLDRTIVNVIRRRNMAADRKRASPKWQQVVATVDWIAAQMPVTSEFQIYTFNVKAAPLVEGSQGKWLQVAEGEVLDEAMARLREVVPAGGTSLHAAFTAIAGLKPRPDNVYLLVDGLPTVGAGRSRGRVVSGPERLDHFRSALRKLPLGIPTNVILFPMEGDPMAVSAYWEVAHATRGSLMSPSADWP